MHWKLNYKKARIEINRLHNANMIAAESLKKTMQQLLCNKESVHTAVLDSESNRVLA